MDKIQKAKTSKELIALWKDIAKNSFLNWYVNPSVPEEAINDFIAIGEDKEVEQNNVNQNNQKENKHTQKENKKFKQNHSVKQKNEQSQLDSEKQKREENKRRFAKSFPKIFEGSPSGLETQKRLLAELLNKNQLYVNLSEIEDKDFKVSKQDKKLNQLFFNKK